MRRGPCPCFDRRHVWRVFNNGTTTTPQPMRSVPAPNACAVTFGGSVRTTAALTEDVLVLIQGVNKLHKKVRIPAGTAAGTTFAGDDGGDRHDVARAGLLHDPLAHSHRRQRDLVADHERHGLWRRPTSTRRSWTRPSTTTRGGASPRAIRCRADSTTGSTATGTTRSRSTTACIARTAEPAAEQRCRPRRRSSRTSRDPDRMARARRHTVIGPGRHPHVPGQVNGTDRDRAQRVGHLGAPRLRHLEPRRHRQRLRRQRGRQRRRRDDTGRLLRRQRRPLPGLGHPRRRLSTTTAAGAFSARQAIDAGFGDLRRTFNASLQAGVSVSGSDRQLINESDGAGNTKRLTSTAALERLGRLRRELDADRLRGRQRRRPRRPHHAGQRPQHAGQAEPRLRLLERAHLGGPARLGAKTARR